MPSPTTRPDLETEAFFKWCATREPAAAEAERAAFEAGWKAGARAVLTHTAELSQATRALQHVLALLGLIANGEEG